MLRFRVVNIKGKYRFVQVFRYESGKRVILKHIGSGNTDEEIASLIEIAKVYISDITKQSYLFEEDKPKADAGLLDQFEFIGIYYNFFYHNIKVLQQHIGFGFVADALLNDLVVMRIFDPGSKLRSIELLETYFGIKHRFIHTMIF